MSCARAHFLTLDNLLAQEFGEEKLAELQSLLRFDPNTL